MNDDWKMICFVCGHTWDEKPERGVVRSGSTKGSTGSVLPRTHCPECGEPEDIGVKDGGNHGLIGMEIKQIGYLRYVENDESAQIVYGDGNAEYRWLNAGEIIATLERAE